VHDENAGSIPKADLEPGQAAVVGHPPPPASWPLGSLWWLLLVGAATAALCLPFLRTVYWFGDEGVLLHGAERMLHGRRLYADFFEILPPGGFILTAAWFQIVGISILSARSLAILTIVGITCFTYLACRRASGNARLSAAFTIGWIMMAQQLWVVVSHHWFTTLFSMIAVWAALAGVEDERRRLRWPLIAGIAAGMAAIVIETQGALVMMAALLAFVHPQQRPARLFAYLLGCALAPVSVFAYLVESHTLAPAFNDVILWAAKHYTSVQGVPFGWSADAQNAPLKYLFAVAIMLTALMSIRQWRIWWEDRKLLLCAAFGVGAFVSCSPRPDIYYIGVVMPLALPLLLFSMVNLSRWWRPVERHIAVGLMIALIVPAAAAYVRTAVHAQKARVVRTPRGEIAVVRQPGVGRLLSQIAETPPGDAYFFYPYLPMMPFLTAHRGVSRYDLFVPEFTLPAQYQKACVSVMRHASWLVIDRQWTDPRLLKQAFPGMQNPRPPETRQFEHALKRAFKLVATEGVFELRRRRTSGVDAGLCAEIAR